MRQQGTTTQRGLGYPHQAERRRQLKALRDGTPCPRCGHPMYATPQAAQRAGLHPRLWALDLDHTIPRAFGGAGGQVMLAHRFATEPRERGSAIGSASGNASQSPTDAGNPAVVTSAENQAPPRPYRMHQARLDSASSHIMEACADATSREPIPRP